MAIAPSSNFDKLTLWSHFQNVKRIVDSLACVVKPKSRISNLEMRFCAAGRDKDDDVTVHLPD